MDFELRRLAASVFFVGVVQGTGTGPRDRANPRAFAASRQSADRGSSRGSNAHPLYGLHVTSVLDGLLTGTVVVSSGNARRGSAEK